ncbi:hypothetical protein [Nocardioides glacieisoli]|uniref:hypothetical protein n=1 Tax=Nocardioides glacieisoli TaxID=1168730 RepID=UPI0013ECCD0B|nr:hypothetical protein [Nocardioides glacieisoli]
MSKNKKSRRSNRRISVRSELRREPDLQKIAGTVIALAMAQAEKEAQADAERKSEQEPPHVS